MKYLTLLVLLLLGCGPRVMSYEQVESIRQNCKRIDGFFSATLNPDGTVNRARCVVVEYTK